MSVSFPQRFSGELSHSFTAPTNGLYSITIKARCQSGKQTGKPGGEDLRVEIDGIKLQEIPPVARPQYFNIPPTWNGTELQGKTKTVIFILHLKTGEHTLEFSAKPAAEIVTESAVEKIADSRAIVFSPEEQAEDGDRRPWYTIALINLPLEALTIDATAHARFRDSDDIKLIIDGEVQKNTFSVFHRYWIWSGNIIKKMFLPERQEKTFTITLLRAEHYIELWADRTPILHTFKLDLGEINIEVEPATNGTITDLGEQITEVNLRSKASVEEDSQILASIPLEEKVHILEERVEGDSVPGHTNIWHKILHKNQEGYVLSSYVDIDGQTTEDIKNFITRESVLLGAKPEYILALAECESKFKPFAVSEADAKGVMQISKDLLQDLNDQTKPFYSPIDDPFDFKQNIKGGIRYFLYLYNIYSTSEERLAKTVAAYNAGPGNVPVDEPLRLELYEEQTQRLVRCVQDNVQKYAS